MLWAGNFVAGKFLVGHTDHITLIIIRWGIAVIVLLPFLLWKEKTLRFQRKHFWLLVGMGATGIALFNFFMFLALEYTSADNVGLISTLNPISIAIFSFFIMKDRLSARQLSAMIVSFFGILVVLTNGHLNRLLTLEANIGDIYMLLAVVSWGLYSVLGKKVMSELSPLVTTFWAGVFGNILVLPFLLDGVQFSHITASFWIASLYTGIGATVLGMVFWNIGVQKVGSTKSGMFLNFNPIFTAILAYFLLGETMTTGQIIGAFVVIVGVYFFTTKRAYSFAKLAPKKAS